MLHNCSGDCSKEFLFQQKKRRGDKGAIACRVTWARSGRDVPILLTLPYTQRVPKRKRMPIHPYYPHKKLRKTKS